MINYSIPPKPGEVSIDTQKMVELLYLPGHTQSREALLVGAGYAIGSLLANECETLEDATAITGELVSQTADAFEAYASTFRMNFVNAQRFAALLEYGMERGRVTADQSISS